MATLSQEQNKFRESAMDRARSFAAGGMSQADYAKSLNTQYPTKDTRPTPMPGESNLFLPTPMSSPGVRYYDQPAGSAEARPQPSGAAPRQSNAGAAPGQATAPQPTYTTPNNSALNAFSRASAASMRDSVRPVDGAPGVLRYDRQGQSPLYSNVGGGDFRAGVSTIGAGDGAMAMERNNRAAEIYASMRQPQQGQQRGGFLGGASGGIEAPQTGDSSAMFERWGFENQLARNTNPMVSAALMNKRLDSNNELEAERVKANAGLAQEALKGQFGLQEADINGQYGLQNTGLRGQFGLQEADTRGRYGLEEAELRNRGALEEASARGSFDLERQRMANEGSLATARIGADARMRSAEALPALKVLTDPQSAPEQKMAAERYMTLLNERAFGGEPQTYANGGMVGRPMYGQTPQAAQVLPEVNEYRDYAMGAKSLGLPAVPFDQFLAMREGAKQVAAAKQGAMAFANGGEVPDPYAAGGKMVIDANPNAPTDSIPAVIDESAPAKLDSGEFVIPKDVVAFFGTDRLNKMIAQARKGSAPQGADDFDED